MTFEVPVIAPGEREFIDLPPSIRMAILMPTYRWTPMAAAVIGSCVGIANEEVAVLIADNSENPEKRKFLKQIRSLNPNVFAIHHEKNVGGAANISYLYDWCATVEYCATMADDDWMSPTYHNEALAALLENPEATCASAGTSLADFGDGRLVNVNQPSMRGATPLERMQQWNSEAARITNYNASKRNTLNEALAFLKETPIHGLTFAEDIWELNRLAYGDFIQVPGSGCFVHYPANGSRVGDSNQRFYELLCKGFGLQYPFVFFTGFAAAVLCAIFLMGKDSPVQDETQRVLCGQHVFSQIFVKTYLPKVTGVSSREAAAGLFASNPKVLDGFLRFTTPEYSASPVFDVDVLEWFTDLLRFFETPGFEGKPLLSERFTEFTMARLSR